MKRCRALLWYDALHTGILIVDWGDRLLADRKHDERTAHSTALATGIFFINGYLLLPVGQLLCPPQVCGKCDTTSNTQLF
jgi:hypothetical protein